MSESHKGKIPKNVLTKENHPMFGKHHTKESKQKMKDAKKGKILNQHLKGIKKPRKICPHCNRDIDITNYNRWHGDNCKYKTSF
jgi:hypothetical protein